MSLRPPRRDATNYQVRQGQPIVRAGAGEFTGWADDPEGSYLEAYDLAQRAVSVDVRHPVARFALGLVCMWTRRPERAMAEFEQAIKLNPSFAAAHVILGQLHLYRGEAGASDRVCGEGRSR